VRILANENLARTVIVGLRAKGHDVLSVKESLRGEKDDAILALAQSEKRIVLTQDKDFGELAFHLGLSADCGVILLRLSGTDPDADNRRALDASESRADWQGHFSVITDERIRVRPLPTNRNGKG
jgi:predicted nuclease of predicted toxin-antitoxin system